MFLENNYAKLEIDEIKGSVTSFILKSTGEDMIGEKRLAANFSLLLPEKDYMCNYIDGMDCEAKEVEKGNNEVTFIFSEMKSEKGVYSIDLSFTISLKEDSVTFSSELVNNTDLKVTEFWFPRIGGWTNFNGNRDAKMASAQEGPCTHDKMLFRYFPGARGLGAPAAEFVQSYPGNLVMPWGDFYDEKSDTGMYMGYHDRVMRYSSFYFALKPNRTGLNEAWLDSEKSKGVPVGMEFAHVRYPYLGKNKKYSGGEFVFKFHKGDWHEGALSYSEWFQKNFATEKSPGSLRNKSLWLKGSEYSKEKDFSENEAFNTARKYLPDCRDICYETIKWPLGLQDTEEEIYNTPQDNINRENFRKYNRAVKDSGGMNIVGSTFNLLDTAAKNYSEKLHRLRRMDAFEDGSNSLGIANRQRQATLAPELCDILEKQFARSAADGAGGFYLHALHQCSTIDLNPLSGFAADEALCEELIGTIEKIYNKCKEENPDFSIAAEACQDRLIPFCEVFGSGVQGFDISPFRYLFRNWTACQNITGLCDQEKVNAAVLTGAVIAVSPEVYACSYKGILFRNLLSYINEAERIRGELKDIIFTGRYLDMEGGKILEENEGRFGSPSALKYKVHMDEKTGKKAIVVVNTSDESKKYKFSFDDDKTKKYSLYSLFRETEDTNAGSEITIDKKALQIIVTD